MKSPKKKTAPIKSKGLRLIIQDSEIVDQYGRILEEYTNDKGKKDLRPTGRCTYARH